MKNIIKKLSNTNISMTYMFVLVGVTILMMVGYFSYAWFTVQGVQKYSIVTGNLTGTLAIGSNTANINGVGVIEYTPTTDSDTITITVTNSSDRTVKNSLYYYNLDDDTITLGYTSDSSTIPSVTGIEVEKGKSLTYKIKITGAKGKTIKIGSSMGLINSDLALPNGASALEKFSLTVSETLLAGVGDNGKIDTSDSEQTFITGTDPNNYIWYSGKLWRAVSIDTTDNSVKLVTQWDITSISYNVSGTPTFKGSYIEQWLNDTSVDGFLGNLREPEKFIKMDSVWDASLYKQMKTTMVTDAVGLLNMYEYKSTGKADGYLKTGLSAWMLTPYSESTTTIYILTNTSIGIYNAEPTALGGVRPAINLKSNIKILDGAGTSDDPYRLEGDNDVLSSGTLLSTRYSGEYISFGTGENNLYRIVSHENGIGTKIASAIPLKESGSFKEMTFGSDGTFSQDNVIGTFLNNDYLENETYLTSEQVNMIEDNTTWYLGGLTSDNYKLAKYQNVAGNSLVTKVATGKVGLLRLGELMSSQFDTFEAYWLLSPTYDGSSSVNYSSEAGSTRSLKATLNCAIKPAMNLKSNVVITGGDGTKNNPFQIKLG